MKRVGPQNASRHRTSSDLIGPSLNSVRFLRPEMSAQERTRCTQRVKSTYCGMAECGQEAPLVLVLQFSAKRPFKFCIKLFCREVSVAQHRFGDSFEPCR
jgi:hypothetical protein